MASDPSPTADTVTVRLDDLLLLLRATESLVGSKWAKNDPIVSAIDRMGDACLKVRLVAHSPRPGI